MPQAAASIARRFSVHASRDSFRHGRPARTRPKMAAHESPGTTKYMTARRSGSHRTRVERSRL